MITFHIISSHEDEAKEIAREILVAKYALHMQLDQERKMILNNNGELMDTVNYKLSFITKALLYSEIELFVKEIVKGKFVYMYSLPISQMNVEHSAYLRENLK
ncbi:MAG: divalent cation tolerance protein CutA [Sphingobacteriaceae bacterium]|nr:divalent cation tolerance protein CutA [Sphingobacteriaceae bacterium]